MDETEEMRREMQTGNVEQAKKLQDWLKSKPEGFMDSVIDERAGFLAVLTSELLMLFPISTTTAISLMPKIVTILKLIFLVGYHACEERKEE